MRFNHSGEPLAKVKEVIETADGVTIKLEAVNEQSMKIMKDILGIK